MNINKLLKLNLLLILTILFATSITAEYIILDSSNNFIDELETDVTIYKEGFDSAVYSTNLEFACGTCDSADFENAIKGIGGSGGSICNYDSGIPMKIVKNDDQLCVKSTLTNQKYDINIHTWSAHSTCTDADNGESCSSSSNQFAYTRIQKVILKSLDIEVDSNSDKDIQEELNGYTISKEAKPGDNIELIIEIENGFEEDMDLDVEIEVTIEKIDDGEDISKKSSKEKISFKDDEKFKIELTLPTRIDDEEYDLEIIIEAEDEDNNIFTIEKTYVLEIEKDKHNIQISTFELNPANIQCQDITQLNIELTNQGSEEENEISLVISNEELNLYLKQKNIELETGTDSDAQYNVQIPLNIKGVAQGTYPITIETFRDSSKLEDSTILNLIIEECTSNNPTTKPTNTQIEIIPTNNREILSANPIEQTILKEQKPFFEENFKSILIISIVLGVLITLLVIFSRKK